MAKEEDPRRDPKAADPDVFISYASRDRQRVREIAESLESAGVRVWRDQEGILGGEVYGPKIVRAIKTCRIVMLMCSDAAMRSRNVRQEIKLAWKYHRPYLPLLLEPVSYPEQVEYWLEGWQWIEVLDRPREQWLRPLLRSLVRAGLACGRNGPGGKSGGTGPAAHKPQADGLLPIRTGEGLEGLRRAARFTDQIWPVPAACVRRGASCPRLRDLGAPQDNAKRGHRLGSRVCLAIETDREGHVLLLDQGTSGKTYCLCPSAFAPDTRLPAGRSYLPQGSSEYDAFVVTGEPGREHLLGIVTDQPLGLDWMPGDPRTPARVLGTADIDELLGRLRRLEEDRWVALSTYFDVLE